MRVRIRRRLSRPEPCKPVKGRYYFENGLLKLENQAWLPFLTEEVRDHITNAVKRVGRNPRDIDPETLTAAGHPPRSATDCIKLYLKDLDMEYNDERDRRMSRLRELCLACAGKALAVRDCAIINCPLWNHRLGFNPHNFHKRRGRKTK